MAALLPAEMTEFLDVLEFDRMYSNNTIVSYRRNLEQFIRWLAENGIALDVYKITPLVIRNYITFLKSSLKGVSIKQKIATLKSFYDYLRGLDDTLDIPSFPKKIKAMLCPVHTLSKEQILELLDAVHQRNAELSALPSTPRRLRQTGNCIRDKAILSLLIGTGIRVHELTEINTADIDWQRHTIKIRGKGNKERTVFFGVPLITEALETYSVWRSAQNLTHSAFFVNSKDYERITTRSIQRMMKPYLKAAGLPEWVSPHILRHSFATITIENGANVKAVSQLLGHARVETTVKYYLHLSSEFVREAYALTNPFASSTPSVAEIIAQRRSMVFQV